MTTQTDVIDFAPHKGQAFQGDIMFMRLPDDIKLDRADEIPWRDIGLVIAEGEVTGHHHLIKWVPQPANFLDEAMAREAIAKVAPPARLYRDEKAVDELVRRGILTTDRLAIGFLTSDEPVVVRHDEHGGIRIPAGTYYVGGQREWDAAEERRVQD